MPGLFETLIGSPVLLHSELHPNSGKADKEVLQGDEFSVQLVIRHDGSGGQARS